jgi:hypothetical protein
MISFFNTLYDKHFPKGFKSKLVFKYFPYYKNNIFPRLFLSVPLMVALGVLIHYNLDFSNPAILPTLMFLPVLSFMLFVSHQGIVSNIMKGIKFDILNEFKNEINKNLTENQSQEVIKNAVYEFNLIQVAIASDKKFDNQKFVQSCLDLIEKKTLFPNIYETISEFIANDPNTQIQNYKPYLNMSLSELEIYVRKHVATVLNQGTRQQVNKFLEENVQPKEETIFSTTKTLSSSL